MIIGERLMTWRKLRKYKGLHLMETLSIVFFLKEIIAYKLPRMYYARLGSQFKSVKKVNANANMMSVLEQSSGKRNNTPCIWLVSPTACKQTNKQKTSIMK